MCRSTCDAYYILCELAAGLACHAFEGIAGAWWLVALALACVGLGLTLRHYCESPAKGDECTGAASGVLPSLTMLAVAGAAAVLAPQAVRAATD